MADQQSKTDQNGRSTLLAVNSSGELRRVVVADDGTISLSGALTDTQLRASPVPVDTELPAAAALADGATPLLSTSKIGVVQFGMTGTATSDILRTSNIFKTVEATASGNTVVWTPTSGKKFRLMAYAIELTADIATTGGADLVFKFQDATTDIGMALSAFVPAVAGTAFGNNISTGWRILGNGKLSALADNILNINLSAALSAGKCRVNVAGIEE